MKSTALALALGLLPGIAADAAEPRRFFADDSFWNQPIPENPAIDERTDHWISLLEQDQTCDNFGINLTRYTMPVYLADRDTPTVIIKERSARYHHHPEFRGRPVPMPADFQPSPGTDMHVAIVDHERGRAWDMWAVEKSAAGEWTSNTGMAYDLYGSGVFDPSTFEVEVGTSIHSHGPGRAAGVPIIAGLVMHHEVQAGRIEHKIAGAVRFVAYQEYVHPPAIWTDGNVAGGIPEGATIQLDPELDLDTFELTPEEKVVARALQEYGMVIVDFASANVLYGEGLWWDDSRSWDGLVREWEGGLSSIPLDHYRVLEVGETRKGGDRYKEYFRNWLEMPRECESGAVPHHERQ